MFPQISLSHLLYGSYSVSVHHVSLLLNAQKPIIIKCTAFWHRKCFCAKMCLYCTDTPLPPSSEPKVHTQVIVDKNVWSFILHHVHQLNDGARQLVSHPLVYPSAHHIHALHIGALLPSLGGIEFRVRLILLSKLLPIFANSHEFDVRQGFKLPKSSSPEETHEIAGLLESQRQSQVWLLVSVGANGKYPNTIAPLGRLDAQLLGCPFLRRRPRFSSHHQLLVCSAGCHPP
mmetsp:Transcript_152958/g.281928  ORF Transcript_152958/g.281928 Transcript_152958/m.281928 type:complete len:231 (+) Transcript_152958:1185-1877(+)